MNMGIHVIQFPSKRWGYVGTVPNEIYYEDGATEEEIERGNKFGGRFGPRRRTFDTREEAVKFAQEKGYTTK